MHRFAPFDRVRITMGNPRSKYTLLCGTVVPFGGHDPYVAVERDDLGVGSQPHLYLPYQLEHLGHDAFCAGDEDATPPPPDERHDDDQ